MHRVMLFVPTSDPRKLEKVKTLEAKSFLLDLEDSVAPDHKDAARRNLVTLADELYTAKPCWVRVNSMDTPHFFWDLQAALAPRLGGLNIPKLESALQLQIADWYLTELERSEGLSPGSTRLMATVETAKGVENAFAIAAATPRLDCLCFGSADYSRDLKLDWPAPEGVVYPAVVAAKVRVVQASAAAGLEAPHDGASAQLRDLAALEREALAARQLGFSGKHAIHPAQVAVLEKVFQPSPAQIEWAKRVLAYHAEHPAQGSFQLDGRMVDAPVIARAQQIVEEAGA